MMHRMASCSPTRNEFTSYVVFAGSPFSARSLVVVKISRMSLCSNLQGLYKKVLSSEPGELFWKEEMFFYLQKTDKKWGQNFQ